MLILIWINSNIEPKLIDFGFSIKHYKIITRKTEKYSFKITNFHKLEDRMYYEFYCI